MLQYLYQVGLFSILPQLYRQIIVPPAVVEELNVGIAAGIDLPNLSEIEWIDIYTPQSLAVLAMVGNLGKGETQTLALGVELSESVIGLDDRLARQAAEILNVNYTGTLGLLLDAKNMGLLPRLLPVLDQLENAGFRLAKNTRETILRLAQEVESPGR